MRERLKPILANTVEWLHKHGYEMKSFITDLKGEESEAEARQQQELRMKKNQRLFLLLHEEVPGSSLLLARKIPSPSQKQKPRNLIHLALKVKSLFQRR